ncbi:hypothetical protein FOXYSP1_17724 [Fusarium oxysporum f. sp. phaseoli]
MSLARQDVHHKRSRILFNAGKFTKHWTIYQDLCSGRPRKLTVQQFRWSHLTNNNTPSYTPPLRSQIEGYAKNTAI